VSFDFVSVNVVDRANPGDLPPTIQAAYAPTINIHPGDPVTFKVRTFRTTDGEETWDFGDGSPAVKVKSDGNVDLHAKNGFAVTTHRFTQPGNYIVSVARPNKKGYTARANLWVPVEGSK
jgi:hypothetical protein